MANERRLIQAILDIGLEDLIGLPELLFEHDVLAAAGTENAIDDISAALVELCEQGQVKVWVGTSYEDAVPIDLDVAIAVLRDRTRYFADALPVSGPRVFYANVANIP